MSRDVSGVSQHVCVCLGPVLASHAPSQPAAAVAYCRGWGLIPIAGWSYVSLWLSRTRKGSSGGRKKGVV